MPKSPLTPPLESAARCRWRVLIRQQQHSGLSQAEFCRRHCFSPQTFSSYKRLLGFSSAPLRGRQSEPALDAPPGFLPLRVRPVPTAVEMPRPTPQVATEATWIEVWLCNGRRLRVPSSVDVSNLQRLVIALEGSL
jgi:hypothetical protein